MQSRFRLTFLFAAVLSAGSAIAGPIQFSASGAAPGDIAGTVDSFRAALGALNPNVAGSFGSGRREINWDGVPDASAAPNNLPFDFFNTTSPRGVTFSTPGAGFQVSADSSNPTLTPVQFGHIDPTYPAQFQTFSAERLFTPLGSNVMDVLFHVPGSPVASSTSAFGAVFSDVDGANITSLQFFDTSNNSLGVFFVPVAGQGLSFLGVYFNAGEQIGRVRITTGNSILGAGVLDVPGQADLVVLDDFIYAEPAAAVPEPSTWLLMSGGAALLAWMRRRR